MSQRLQNARRRYPMGNRSGILCEEKGKRRGRREEKQGGIFGEKKWQKDKNQISAAVIGDGPLRPH